MRNIHGQVLRVGVRRGERTRPELLIFNGIGASIELVAPFLRALSGPEAIILCWASAARPCQCCLTVHGRWRG
jgi:hypothetical protein